MNIYINKEISGSNNLIDLIRDSVVYNEDFTVKYEKQSIRSVPPDTVGRNTAVNVSLHTKGMNIEATAFYKRPDISVVPDTRPDPEEDLPVFIYDGPIEYIYNQDNLSDYVKPLIKDRLNITQDSFLVENFDTSRWGDGLVKFDIVADQYSEVIIGKTHGFLKSEIPEHFIFDQFSQYGLLTPQIFSSGQSQDARPKNKESFFKRTSVVSLDTVSLGNIDSDIHTSMIKSYIDKSYTDEKSEEYDISGFIQNTDSTSTRFVKIKNSTDYELFGKYKTKQFDPSKDFINKHIDKWNIELEGKLIYNTLKERIEFYAYDDIVGEAVTLSDAAKIQDGIYKELFGSYGFPVDTATMQKDFLSEITSSGVPKPTYKFRYDNSAIVKNGPYEIHIVYEKQTRCKGVNIFPMIDGVNSIGAIEGVSDGWSTGNIEWWKIDAGLVVDQNGNVITKQEDLETAESIEVKDHKKNGTSGSSSSDRTKWIKNSTPNITEEDDSHVGPVDLDKERVEKAQSNAKYLHTDLDTITDPNLNGFIL